MFDPKHLNKDTKASVALMVWLFRLGFPAEQTLFDQFTAQKIPRGEEGEKGEKVEKGAETFSFGRMCAFSNEVMGQKTEGGGWEVMRRGSLRAVAPEGHGPWFL